MRLRRSYEAAPVFARTCPGVTIGKALLCLRSRPELRSIPEDQVVDCVSFYPPGPTEVPRRLTRVPLGYRVRVAAMIAGLFAFLLLYLALIAFAGLFGYTMLTMPMKEADGAIILFLVMKFGGALAAGLVALLLVKGLCKGQSVPRTELLPLDEEAHPELFAFIRRVYQDAGSGAPRHVYASPDVTAAVIFNRSLLNLVVPPQKDLLIGLGLVNVLT